MTENLIHVNQSSKELMSKETTQTEYHDFSRAQLECQNQPKDKMLGYRLGNKYLK